MFGIINNRRGIRYFTKALLQKYSSGSTWSLEWLILPMSNLDRETDHINNCTPLMPCGLSSPYLILIYQPSPTLLQGLSHWEHSSTYLCLIDEERENACQLSYLWGLVAEPDKRFLFLPQETESGFSQPKRPWGREQELGEKWIRKSQWGQNCKSKQEPMEWQVEHTFYVAQIKGF